MSGTWRQSAAPILSALLYVRKLGVIGEYVWLCMCACVSACLVLARCACNTFPTHLTTATLNVAGAKAHAAASCSRNCRWRRFTLSAPWATSAAEIIGSPVQARLKATRWVETEEALTT